LAKDKGELLRIKVFQTTLATIKQSLASQANFLSELINKDILNIYEAKERSMGSGAEKVQKLKEYKNTVFESYFAQIYSVRVSNLVSLITLTQTGRRYYKN
jgi:hypothetical protein